MSPHTPLERGIPQEPASIVAAGPPRTNESFRLRPIQLERNGINLLLELMQKQQG
ncbi:MAG: hypothetical protein RBS47_10945 [Hydrogenophaga sp.]|jgi:hypothetical protein|uniref:hypothetical protein n=1 Tax=Hydrogenophaga sp. TaxID=1904254 RepID=UPI002A359050|nr:hypothetical protein [Hydrogenophaga sp.]MDX9969530.1 hypothetical protein [Hydrogenophaga sp.]